MNTEINLNTINIEQLAVILDISPATIKSDLDRAPWRLPVPVDRGKKTHVIWMEVVVYEWMMQRSKRPEQPNQNTSHPPVRGRPKKIRKTGVRPLGGASDAR